MFLAFVMPLDIGVGLDERISANRGGITGQSSDAEALVVTSWRVGAPSRTTRVEFASGAHLVLDHVGVAGYLFQAGNVVETFGSDGTVPRGHQRYRALYRSFLGDAAACYDTDATLRLSRILLAN